MTLKGHKQLDPQQGEELADLFYICLLLHPSRIGRAYGVHGQYVRQKHRDRDCTKVDKNKLIACVTKYLQSLHF